MKSEISTRRYHTSHLLSYLVKFLQAKNQRNPFDKCKVYERTNNVRVYAKGPSYADSTMILRKEIFVSGFIDVNGNLYICFVESVGKGINLHPLTFNDNRKWCLNL